LRHPAAAHALSGTGGKITSEQPVVRLAAGGIAAVCIPYTEARIDLSIDHPVPELIAAEDASTLRAIDEGLAQLDGGQGIPLEELRQELARRCSR
jgi:hypothetical protein